jgi:shikimate kinase
MNKNTRLEIAVEIMAAKIARTSREGKNSKDEEMKKLIEEREEMYRENQEIINKIIDVYGKEIKEEYNHI